MRILKYNDKLVEEISYVDNSKVVFLRYIREEDKYKCPHCQKPIDKDIAVVEGCLNWEKTIKPVETLKYGKI